MAMATVMKRSLVLKNVLDKNAKVQLLAAQEKGNYLQSHSPGRREQNRHYSEKKEDGKEGKPPGMKSGFTGQICPNCGGIAPVAPFGPGNPDDPSGPIHGPASPCGPARPYNPFEPFPVPSPNTPYRPDNAPYRPEEPPKKYDVDTAKGKSEPHLKK